MMPVIQTLTPLHGVIIHLRSNPPRGFGDRAQFDPSDVQLSVNGIQAQEGGLYRCRVDFQRSQTSNVLVNLTVIGKGIS